jgi:hypothetical protein
MSENYCLYKFTTTCIVKTIEPMKNNMCEICTKHHKKMKRRDYDKKYRSKVLGLLEKIKEAPQETLTDIEKD